ncbi:succinylglutamate desuccinylase/aspartoacylase family protein [Parahaliea aestuarii]|uniref:Succinylglutamate desuccinylase/aspartoacylase family protein n=1 Tax=Parahaliea aestuarii TaxID=1852021 RepID=A0A5C9A183_9GAMM|nr:succinylglutamate desuccinylase/aspartoacylase family protein [Parahaliea aestuarii]TXS94518.1 succinylglutamate desuccinylase/aspartoacylase family protein [Parahaliea aestuarii]
MVQLRPIVLAAVLALFWVAGPGHAADEARATDSATVQAPPPDNEEGDSTTPAGSEDSNQSIPRAENVDLNEPVTPEESSPPPALEEIEPTAAPVIATTELKAPVAAVAPAPQEPPPEGEPGTPADPNSVAAAVGVEEAASPAPFILLGTEVPRGTSTRLSWAPSQSFEGIYSATPVLVVNGAEPGPVLCLTAAVHGDELNGVETVRRVLYNLDAGKLSGTVVGVPIVNLQGFHRSSRYLSDRRDLNRYFPGDPGGSSASRIAYSFFHEIIQHCSAVVDLHTGSFYRTNLPQLRGDLTNPQVVKITESFGSTVVLHSDGAEGTLRRAAVEAGIPAVTLEAGAPMVLSEDDVSHSVKGIRTLLNHLGMVSKFRLWGDPEPVYYNSTWQRAPEGGVVFSKVSLGQVVRKGDLLGTVTNPITNVRTEIRSSYDGRILGMALNQVVQPGFATHHIGIQAPEEQISPAEDVALASAAPDPNQPLAGDSAVDANNPDAAADAAVVSEDVEPPSDAAAAAPAVETQGNPEPDPASDAGDTAAVPLDNAEDEDYEAQPRPLDEDEDDRSE